MDNEYREQMDKTKRERRLRARVGATTTFVAIPLITISVWLCSLGEPHIQFAAVILNVFFFSLMVIFSSQIDAVLRPTYRKFDQRIRAKMEAPPPTEDQWLAEVTEDSDLKGQ
jgi:hypothetical protein